MKILVTGSSGQLACAFKCLSTKYPGLKILYMDKSSLNIAK